MNTVAIFELIDLAISLAHSQGDGTIQGETEVAKTLLDIYDKVREEYEEHSGKMLDLGLIPIETRI
jgi:hypothetical protein